MSRLKIILFLSHYYFKMSNIILEKSSVKGNLNIIEVAVAGNADWSIREVD